MKPEGRGTQTVESGDLGSAGPQLLDLGQGIKSLSLELHSEIEEPSSLVGMDVKIASNG